VDPAAADLRMHPDVLFVERPDGSAWLLHMSARTLRLDTDSTQLLKAIVDGDAESAIHDMVAQFGVAEAEVRQDVAGFIDGLRRQRVLEIQADRTRRDRGLAGRLIAGALALADRVRHPRRHAWWLLLVARLSVAFFGWAATIRAWERRYPQPGSNVRVDTAALEQIDATVRDTAARSLLHHECKERALACLALTRAHGMQADLIIGLMYAPLAAHVWVECGPRIISDLPEHCRAYEEVTRYGGTAAQ
jgi:hypothetical protein